jgi:hypothetical protein
MSFGGAKSGGMSWSHGTITVPQADPRRPESRPEDDCFTLLLSKRATVRTGSESVPSACQWKLLNIA